MTKNSAIVAAAILFLTVGHESLVLARGQETITPASTQSDIQQKKAALDFVQLAQAYLGVTALQWQNFLMNPGPDGVNGVQTRNSDYKAKVDAKFNELMALPGKNEGLSDRTKDFYAAWMLAFETMRPVATDTRRVYEARTSAEMARMDALAARLKMDLK